MSDSLQDLKKQHTKNILFGVLKSDLEEAKAAVHEANLTIQGQVWSVVQALVEARVIQTHNGSDVALIGHWRSIVVPQDSWDEDIAPGVPLDIWREVILSYIETQGIKLVLLDEHEMDAHMESTEIQTIHLFREANRNLSAHIQEALADRPAPKVTIMEWGRAPYGYARQDGKLVVRQDQAEAVSWIFSYIRKLPKDKPCSKRALAEELKEKFPTTTTKKKRKNGEVERVTKIQYWDHSKLRRILAKARLYALGEYTAPSGETIVDKSLRFLPPEWADVQWPAHSSVPSTPEKEGA